MTKPTFLKYFKTSPEIIRLAVRQYIRFPLSLHNVEDLLHERGIDVSMRWCSIDGTGLAQCLPLSSEENAFSNSEFFQNASGTSMRFSRRSMARGINFTAPLITKAKFLKPSPRNAEATWRH